MIKHACFAYNRALLKWLIICKYWHKLLLINTVRSTPSLYCSRCHAGGHNVVEQVSVRLQRVFARSAPISRLRRTCEAGRAAAAAKLPGPAAGARRFDEPDGADVIRARRSSGTSTDRSRVGSFRYSGLFPGAFHQPFGPYELPHWSHEYTRRYGQRSRDMFSSSDGTELCGAFARRRGVTWHTTWLVAKQFRQVDVLLRCALGDYVLAEYRPCAVALLPAAVEAKRPSRVVTRQ